MRVIKVWEFPIRAIHWLQFFSIVLLSFTGVFIHWPYLASPSFLPSWTLGYGSMGLARLIHLSCGWALLACLAGRFVWGIIGNSYAKLINFFPYLTKSGREDVADALKYYTFMQPKMKHHLGHNAMASMSYTVFFTMIAFEVLTGFAMWSQMDPNGTAYQLTGWIFTYVSNAYVRLAHHFVMYMVFGFFITHIYAMIASDIIEQNGIASSIFSGFKFDDK